MNLRDPIIRGGKAALHIDLTQELRELYPDVTEEIDANFPQPLIDKININTFINSNYGHDKVPRRSITGLIIFLERTLVFYLSKRKGAIKTSTYRAEFCAVKTGVEETIAVCYIMLYLDIAVETAFLL